MLFVVRCLMFPSTSLGQAVVCWHQAASQPDGGSPSPAFKEHYIKLTDFSIKKSLIAFTGGSFTKNSTVSV